MYKPVHTTQGHELCKVKAENTQRFARSTRCIKEELQLHFSTQKGNGRLLQVYNNPLHPPLVCQSFPYTYTFLRIKED